MPNTHIAGFKGQRPQSARLESSCHSEIQSSWISGDVSVPALRVNGGLALHLGTGSERAGSTHGHLPARVRPDALQRKGFQTRLLTSASLVVL